MSTAIIFTDHSPRGLIYLLNSIKSGPASTGRRPSRRLSPEAFTKAPILVERAKNAASAATIDTAEGNDIISRILEGRSL